MATWKKLAGVINTAEDTIDLAMVQMLKKDMRRSPSTLASDVLIQQGYDEVNDEYMKMHNHLENKFTEIKSQLLKDK